ncbi:SSI family serine proteinase inhibitor [Streptomyces dysideae]|uniref:Subtilisin inhibitor domain-containing protein n=1 Tax=Streptomyces dysideae TaxID=909626 RepID=A0A101UZ95_9ACTN|nr:SSI family serine proteinase inhibitor [Streptomyces dysideae]KUO19644.1 hypothetical protein AQJ91_17595 [Streptomyces dysideae]
MLQVTRSTRTARIPRARRLRRFVVLAGVVCSSVAPGLAHGVAYAQAAPLGLTPLRLAPPSGDHLTVTVRKAGDGADGTFELYCHPGGGSHPDVGGACAALDRGTEWGRNAFAPVPRGSMCTMQYGGPATAHVTGTWVGRPVDATFDRGDGCRIARWDRLVPLLPDLRPRGWS